MSTPTIKIAKTDATGTISSTVISLLLLSDLCQRAGEGPAKGQPTTDDLYHVADVPGWSSQQPTAKVLTARMIGLTSNSNHVQLLSAALGGTPEGRRIRPHRPGARSGNTAGCSQLPDLTSQ